MSSDPQGVYDALAQTDFHSANRLANDITDSDLSRLLSRLTAHEQLYNSLNFGRQRLFRKEDLQADYVQLERDVERTRSCLLAGGAQRSPVPELLSGLAVWCRARADLISIYTSFAAADVIIEDCDHALDCVDDVERRASGLRPHIIGNLTEVLRCELKCLANVLTAELAIQRQSFVDGGLHLYEAQKALAAWSIIRDGSNDGKPDHTKRDIVHFLLHLLASVAHKFGIMFQRVLTREAVEGLQTETLLDDAEVNTCMRTFSLYCDHTHAYNVSLIYLIPRSGPYSVDGYSCRDWSHETPPTGLQAYPAICSYPSNDPPMEHWPNIVSLIQEKLSPLTYEVHTQSRRPSTASISSRASHASTSSFIPYFRSTGSRPATRRPVQQLECFYDQKVDATYVLARLSPTVVISIIHVGKFDKTGVDLAFIKKLRSELGHADVFGEIKCI
ncbi:hypothetical protein HDU85_007403 [Gaertneriomyces sp. JEL0708]|nr:hypothetical protein HDU85_007403 [Gaertneriomyces sp. JEL0708]